MVSIHSRSKMSAWTVAAMIVSIFVWLGLSGDIAMSQTKGKDSLQQKNRRRPNPWRWGRDHGRRGVMAQNTPRAVPGSLFPHLKTGS
jgi:hypothetical protein